MAEPASSWNLLTASLAVSDLTRPNQVWAFLVMQGLVRDEPGDRDRFVQIAREESEPLTGPTVAKRMALRLADDGIALPAGLVPDPWAVLAAERLQAVEPWTGGQRAKDYLELARKRKMS